MTPGTVLLVLFPLKLGMLLFHFRASRARQRDASRTLLLWATPLFFYLGLILAVLGAVNAGLVSPPF
jgi:hypothetical protein